MPITLKPDTTGFDVRRPMLERVRLEFVALPTVGRTWCRYAKVVATRSLRSA